MRSRRLALVAVVALLAYPAGRAIAQLAPRAPEPSGPTLRLGAVLPLTGPGAWFGAEIKQALELAAAEVTPAARRPATASGEGSPAAGATTEGTEPPKADAGGAAPESTPAAPSTDSAGSAATTKPGENRPPTDPVEATDRPRTIAVVVQALDVQPLDVKDAEAEVTKLMGSGVNAIFTASPTPTLAAYPLASARDVLVLHAGFPTEKFPPRSRTLLQLRPSAAARADLLALHAWERGIRRLTVIAGGDPVGRAMRAATAARWRQQGGVASEESVSLDASDLRARLRAASRLGPEAIVLGFQGSALGEAARALRDAGYAGQILAADDDRAARLSGGKALNGALIIADAFVPVPGTRGARFALAYEAKHGSPPSRFAAAAYEAAVLLADAAQQSLAQGRGTGGVRLRDALIAGRPYPSLYAGEVTVRDDGTIARPMALYRVEGEALTFVSYVGLDGRLLDSPPAATP